MRAAERGDASFPDSDEAGEIAWRGIEYCRRGNWDDGLYWLSVAVEAEVQTSQLPGLLFSYLGYGMARYQDQKLQGLKLCRLGAKMDLHVAESYFFLAKTHLLLADKRSAHEVIERGLQVDASHPGLGELVLSLGQRRPPVLPFLSRRHRLNRWLGKVRHRFFGGASRRRFKST